MKMNKNDILGALKSMNVDNGPDNKPIYSRKEILEKLGNFTPKADGKGKYMDKSREKLNTNLAKSKVAPKMESEWKPARADIKTISNRLIQQTNLLENTNPNAFRLNLRSLVLDKTHAKLSLTRGGETAKIDLMYPNANGKITVKIAIDGVEDVIYELALEDEEYVRDFGASILEKIDDMVKEKDSMNYNDYNTKMYDGTGSPNVSDMSPNWVSGNSGLGTIADSDMRKMNDLLALVEADDEETENTDLPADDLGGMEATDTDATAAGDVNAGGEFGADDFSLDGATSGAGGDFGTDIGGIGDFGAEFGGDFGGNAGDAGDVNADSNGGIGVENDDVFLTFRDKTDWLNSSLDTMQKLVASNVADQMQKGEGVILTQDEILNGSIGIKNDSNADIIEKFLKVYPSLDEIEFKEADLNRIEEKLSLDDGQFDSWLQNELPGMRGDSDVTDALNNDMFNDKFTPMGGEDASDNGDLGDFDDFMSATDDFVTPEDGADDLTSDDIKANANETDDSIESEAELSIDDPELNEFPNV